MFYFFTPTDIAADLASVRRISALSLRVSRESYCPGIFPSIYLSISLHRLIRLEVSGAKLSKTSRIKSLNLDAS